MPEREKRKNIEPFIKKKCESLISGSSGIIREIINKSGLNYDFKTITRDEFLTVCRTVKPREHLYHFANSITDVVQHHLGYKIYNVWKKTDKEIDELLRLLPYIDSGLLKCIYDLNNSFLRYLVNDLATMEGLRNENLEAWSETLFDFYMLSKKLRDYCKSYFNENIQNDPW